MQTDERWKSQARKLLSAQIVRKRRPDSVIGRVEVFFDEIKDARCRGMQWRDIAAAISNSDQVKVDAASSAFERLCHERGEPVWGSRRAKRPDSVGANKRAARTVTFEQSPAKPDRADLFTSPDFGREVDDGL